MTPRRPVSRPPASAAVALLGAALALLAPDRARAELSLDHTPLECVASDAFPRVSLRATPFEQATLAWVYFRGKDDSGFYSVRMRRDDTGFEAVLPKPKWLKRFTYYVEVSDTQAGTTRSPEYTTAVEKSREACGTRHRDAVDVASGLIIEKPAQTGKKKPPDVPPGFSVRGTVGDIGMVEMKPGRSTILTGALVAGAVVGIQSQLKGEVGPVEPLPPAYEISFLGSNPPPGGTVSLAGTMSMRFEIDARRPSPSQPARYVRVVFQAELGAYPITCASLYGPIPEGSGTVTVTNLLEWTGSRSPSCQPPFTASRVSATLLAEHYQFMSHAPEVPLGVSYDFAP